MSKEFLANCLEDLLRDLSNSELTWEILVLENGSGDDLASLETKYAEERERIKFIDSDKNLGFGAGHNLLAKNNTADNILVLNPDTQLKQKDVTEKLYELLNSCSEIGVVGPRLVGPTGKLQVWDHGKYFLGNIGICYYSKSDKQTSVGWVSGACLMIKRGVFDQIGGFDERFFLYKEDDDLCVRVAKENLKVIYEPSIEIIHENQAIAKKSVWMKKSMDLFLDKYRSDIGWPVYFAYKTVNKLFSY